MSSDGHPDVVTQSQRDSASRMYQQPVAMVNCPSRRPAIAYPYKTRSTAAPLWNGEPTDVCAMTDYAANAGDLVPTYTQGPHSLDLAKSFDWSIGGLQMSTGVVYLRSEVRVSDIVDGTSGTYLAGEKYLDVDDYLTGEDPGDDAPICLGHGNEVERWTTYLPAASPPWVLTPMQDQPGNTTASANFGSAHPGGCNFVFCDGAVRSINYSIDPEVHRCLGNRNDGSPIDQSKF